MKPPPHQNLSIFAIFPHPYFSISLVEFVSYLCKHLDLTLKKKKKGKRKYTKTWMLSRQTVSGLSGLCMSSIVDASCSPF